MGRKSSISLDEAIRTLALLKENRMALIKFRKHLVLALHWVDMILEVKK